MSAPTTTATTTTATTTTAATTTAAPLSLVVDCRECARNGKPGLVETLRDYLLAFNAVARVAAKPEVSFAVEQLAVGDIVARRRDGTLADIVERKTLQDMASTIAPGKGAPERYDSQKMSMTHERDRDGATLCYLFEVAKRQRGFMEPTCNDMCFAPTRVRAVTLRGMVMNTRVRDRIEVDWSESLEETARWVVARFLALARFDHVVGTDRVRRAPPLAGGSGANVDADAQQLVVTARRKRKEEGASAVTRTASTLETIRLVGSPDALALARHFGSVAALSARLPAPGAQDYRALKKELAALFAEFKGIGEKTAFAIYTTLHACDAPPKPVAAKRARKNAPAASDDERSVAPAGGIAPPGGIAQASAFTTAAPAPNRAPPGGIAQSAARSAARALASARLVAPPPRGAPGRPIDLVGEDADADALEAEFGAGEFSGACA